MNASKTSVVSPAELYWAALEGPVIESASPRSAIGRLKLGYAFERFLPGSIDEVHAVYARDGGRIITCAVDRSRIETLVADGATSILPASIPEWLDTALEPDRFELAAHAFTAPVVQRSRRRLASIGSTTACAIFVLLGMGFHLRADAASRRADDFRRASDAAITARLGPSLGGQLPSLRLTAELRRLQGLNDSALVYEGASDAVPNLVDLVSAWPSRPVAQPQSLTVTGSVLQVRTRHPDGQQAQQFVDTLNLDSSRWSFGQPTMTAGRGEVQLQLTVQRNASRREAAR